MEPLTVLFEEPGAGGELPPALAQLYGGGLRLADDLLYANLITSLDGIAAFPIPRGASRMLRGDADGDRLVMALLRALADAVVIGAGTLRAHRRHRWTAAHIDRERADVYTALGRPDPTLVVVSASGELDPAEPALEGALVLTAEPGARRLNGRLPAATRVRSLGPDPPSGRAIVEAIRAEGYRRVLTEGGPTLLASLVADDVLDELFLTLSPALAGRRSGDGRLGLLEGIHLLPETARWGRLRSVRAQGSHLFLRYAVRGRGN